MSPSSHQVTIASVVEGYGEVTALPALLRRIAAELGVWNLNVPTPYRLGRSSLVNRGVLEDAVRAQARRVAGRGGVLVLLDADDDCPAELGRSLRARADEAAPQLPVGVVPANREFEAWFLAAAASLAGKRGLAESLEAPPEPERIRDAKGWLTRNSVSHSYKPTVDQAALAALFDMELARQKAPSFDKFWRDIERLLLSENV